MSEQYRQHYPRGRVTAGQRVRGALAMLVILGITVGLPYVLLFIAGNPLTNGVLDPAGLLEILTTPDDGTLFMRLLQIVAWIAWAVLALSIVVELLSQLRGVRAPRLPGLGMPQGLARGLVGALMLLFTVIPAGHADAATSGGGPAQEPAAQTAVTTVDQGWGGPVGHTTTERAEANTVSQDGPTSDAARESAGGNQDVESTGHVERADKEVVVQPGDTLWGIAETELGDGAKYPELYQASQDVSQPGGMRLTDPDLIQPGWTIEVPGAGAEKAQAPTPQEKPAPAPEQALDTSAAAEIEANQAVEPGGGDGPGGALVGGDVGGSEAGTVGATPGGATDVVPEREAERFEKSAPVVDVEATSVQDASEAAADGLSVDVPWQVTTAMGVGTLLAAGVVGLLAARRRDQQRTRRPGQQLPFAPETLDRFDQVTRFGADQPSVDTIDLALRSLANHCVRTGKPLPVVRAARLTSRTLELYLEDPALLPRPWAYAGDATVWTLAIGDVALLGPVERAAVPAPHPSLVTIGYDDEHGHVLLNLEHLGALGITGDTTVLDEILASVALELATSRWADELQVTMVGALDGLEPALRTGRVRHLPSASRIIEDLRRRAEDDRAALSSHRAADLYAARATGRAPDTWDPEIVLLGGPVPDDERADLAALVAQLPHVALATITSGDVVGRWSLHIEEGGHAATLAPVGLRLRPQRLAAEHLESIVDLASVVDPGAVSGEAWPEPTVSQIDAVAPVTEPESPQERAARVIAGVEGYTYTEGLSTDEIPQVTADAPPVSAIPVVARAEHGQPVVGASPGVVGQRPEPGAETAAPPAAPPSAVVPPAAPPAAAVPPVVAPPGAAPPATNPMAAAGPPTAETPVVGAPQVGPAATFEATQVAPRVLLLGQADVVGARGSVNDRHRTRLIEFAAFLALHRGATREEIDAAMWPESESLDNTMLRTSAAARLRRWLGQDDTGEDFLPRHQDDSVAFSPAVTSDVDTWEALVGQDPRAASTANLLGALRLVRETPFEGVHPRRYLWAGSLRERLIAEVVDVSYELAKRHLAAGRWRSAQDAVAVGLRIEPAQESLWRLRILAAHQSSDAANEAETVEGLLSITDRLECGLEPATEKLLAALRDPGTDFDRIMANAL